MKSSLQIPHLGGLRFRIVSGHLRSVYQQMNGEWELADLCTCQMVDVPPQRSKDVCRCCNFVSFRVVRSATCPIDDHRLAALKAGAA